LFVNKSDPKTLTDHLRSLRRPTGRHPDTFFPGA
jgi:hypothetical protein